MSSDLPTGIDAWEELERLIDANDVAGLTAKYHALSPHELARSVSRLNDDRQSRLLELLGPQVAADLLAEQASIISAHLLEDLPPERAAAIVAAMPSDEQADVLGELDEQDATAILDCMPPDEASVARTLAAYPPDTAGGLMVREYLEYAEDTSVDEVLADLRQHVDAYREYDVQYVYITEAGTGKLRGMGRIKDLVLSTGSVPVSSIVDSQSRSIAVTADLDALEEFFDRYDFYAAPVVDDRGCMLGAVQRACVEEAVGDRAEEKLLRVGGIVMGEELRTMPVLTRVLRRLAFLVPTLLLTLLAVSVIAIFEDSTIAHVPALAIFLPLVAGLCGCSGNQALAVSMRELSVGLVTPSDYLRVCAQELTLGVALGLVLGVAVFLVTMMMRGDPYLSLVVAAAVPLTMTVAVAVGGMTPLLLKRVGIDPAMASGAVVTVVADLCGFLSVLLLAEALLPQLN